MDPKSPYQAIEEALSHLGTTATLFKDEKAAMQWVRHAVISLIQHKMKLMNLSPEERDVLDPIEAGFLHASDLGTKPRKQRIPWIDAMLERVGEACFCTVVPMQGTMSSWLVGRQTDRQMAKFMLSSLVPTCERLSQDVYYREYHASRKAGDVTVARGSRERWQFNFVQEVGKAITGAVEVDGEFKRMVVQARGDVTRYMNENFLPTRGNRTERLVTTKSIPARHRK